MKRFEVSEQDYYLIKNRLKDHLILPFNKDFKKGNGTVVNTVTEEEVDTEVIKIGFIESQFDIDHKLAQKLGYASADVLRGVLRFRFPDQRQQFSILQLGGSLD